MSLLQVDQIIRQAQEDTLDLPAISESATQFISALGNYSYVYKIGILSDLKSAGYSESYIAGFIAGLQYLTDSIDSMRRQSSERKSSDRIEL